MSAPFWVNVYEVSGFSRTAGEKTLPISNRKPFESREAAQAHAMCKGKAIRHNLAYRIKVTPKPLNSARLPPGHYTASLDERGRIIDAKPYVYREEAGKLLTKPPGSDEFAKALRQVKKRTRKAVKRAFKQFAEG